MGNWGGVVEVREHGWFWKTALGRECGKKEGKGCFVEGKMDGVKGLQLLRSDYPMMTVRLQWSV